MPVLFDAVANSVETSTASLTVTLNVASNAVLLAFCGTVNNTGSVSAVAFNGAALTRLGRAGNTTGSGPVIEIWGLTAPAAGSFGLSANFTTTSRWILTGISYINARAANPFGTVASATASAVTVGMNVSSSTTWITVAQYGCTSQISASNALTRMSVVGNIHNLLVETAGALNTALSAILQGAVSAEWAIAGLPVIFSAAAAGVPATLMCLMGVSS